MAYIRRSIPGEKGARLGEEAKDAQPGGSGDTHARGGNQKQQRLLCFFLEVKNPRKKKKPCTPIRTHQGTIDRNMDAKALFSDGTNPF